ncbi:MAG: YfhO family protein, partial [Muribaculaceae bacterium]|nr:YfhO family protein [Muribaculaceae bacterium]
ILRCLVGSEMSIRDSYSYLPSETFTLLIPDVKGGSSSKSIASTDRGKELMRSDRSGQMTLLQVFSQYFGGEEGTSGPVYVGAIIVALFVFGAVVVRGPLKWALLVLTILSIFLAWGRHMMWFTDLFIDWVPMYSKFRTVESILVIAEFTIPLLAMLGLRELIVSDDRRRMMRPLLWSFGVCIFFCLVAMMAPGLFGAAVMGAGDSATIGAYVSAGALPAGFSMEQFPDVINAVESIRLGMVKSDALRSLLFIGLAGVALYGFCMGKLKALPAVAVVGVLVLVDLYGADKRYLNSDAFSAPRLQGQFVVSAADRSILSDTDPHYRVLDLTAFGSATPSYFHKAIGGYHAAKLTRYQDLIDRMILPGLHSGDLRAVDMLNGKYIISDPSKAPELNSGALGNAWFISELDYVDGADAEMDVLVNEIDPAVQAVADRRFAGVLGELTVPADSTDMITLTSYAPDRLTYEATSANGGVAVFSEVYFPWGWNATIDGKPAEIGRVNYLLRAMKLPAGTHEVTMTFDPRSMHVTDSAAKASVAAIYLLLLLGALLPALRRKSRG